LLLHMEEEDAFYLLATIAEQIIPQYYHSEMVGTCVCPPSIMSAYSVYSIHARVQEAWLTNRSWMSLPSASIPHSSQSFIVTK
jgi:hypothetical protein